MLQQAVEATKSLDQDKLADYLRATTFKTVVGDINFGTNGEWAEPRVLQVQFHDVKGNDLDQFKDISTQVVLTPAELQIRQRDLSVREGEVAGQVGRGLRCPPPLTPRCPLSPLFSGERARVRGGYRRRSERPPLTPTLSPR